MAHRNALHSSRPGRLDLSALSAAELEALKDEIIERSRNAPGSGQPAETGPMMMSDVAWVTDDWAFAHPWEWVELVAIAIVDAAVMIGSAVIAAGAALAASHLFVGHADYARITLAVAAFFAVVFALSAANFALRRPRRAAAGEVSQR